MNIRGAVACATAVLLLVLASGGPARATEWYVDGNAGDTANDGLGAGTAKRYLGHLFNGCFGAASLLAAGDTVRVAAGTYSETIAFDTNYIWCIGADSATTIIDPPGDSATAGLYAVTASNVRGIYFGNFTVRDCKYAVYFYNVDSSTVEHDSISLTWASGLGDGAIRLTNGSSNNLIRGCYLTKGAHGIIAWSSDSNTMAGNIVTNISGNGIYSGGNNNLIAGNWVANCALGNIGTTASGANNVIINNTSCSSGQGGISIFNASNNNQVTGNIVYGNTYEGISITTAGSSGNVIAGNTISNNGRYGIRLSDANGNLVRQNAIYGGTASDTLVYLDGSSSNDTFTDNNIYGNYAYGWGNTSGNAHSFAGNYWGTTNADSVAKMGFGDTASTGVLQFRLAPADTTPGADAVAPETTAITRADTSVFYQVTLSWSAVTRNEDGSALADFLGYRIYRTRSDTETDWKQNAFLLAWGSAATDSSFTDSSVTAGETYIYRVTSVDNHSPQGNESWFSDTVRVVAAAADTAGANHWYVSVATGDTANHGLGAGSPKKYLSQVLAGRNRPVSQLTQGDTVHIAAGTYNDTISIDTDHIWVLGADSQTTTIDYGDSSGLNPGPAGISATGRTGLTIRGLGVANILCAIRWRGVTDGRIENTWLRHCGRSGYGAGIDLANCTSVVIHNNFIYWCGNGITLFGVTGLTVTNNRVDSNCTGGIFADLCPATTVTGNTMRNNWGSGLESIVDCDDWYVANNTVTGNHGTGIYSDLSDRGRYVNNLSSGNGTYGYELYLCNEVRFIGNRTTDNRTEYGQGFLLWRCDSAVVSGCDIDSNGAYALYFDSGTANVAVKCNLAAGQISPDSVVYAAAPDSPVTLTRNWWGTTDSAVISGRIHGPGSVAASWLPFRLGRVDTAANADTIAPTAPDSVTVVDSSYATTSCTIAWTASGSNEEIGGGAPGDLAGYRVYRSRTSDTSYWAMVGTTAAAAYVATGLVAGETYYFRVTAYDNHSPWANESWYSDTIVRVVVMPGPGDFINTGLSANQVDTADLNYLNGQVALYWGAAPADIRCDLDGDGILDFDDIAIFAVRFGQ